jgi:hypothetical protein
MTTKSYEEKSKYQEIKTGEPIIMTGGGTYVLTSDTYPLFNKLAQKYYNGIDFSLYSTNKGDYIYSKINDENKTLMATPFKKTTAGVKLGYRYLTIKENDTFIQAKLCNIFKKNISINKMLRLKKAQAFLFLSLSHDLYIEDLTYNMVFESSISKGFFKQDLFDEILDKNCQSNTYTQLKNIIIKELNSPDRNTNLPSNYIELNELIIKELNSSERSDERNGDSLNVPKTVDVTPSEGWGDIQPIIDKRKAKAAEAAKEKVRTAISTKMKLIMKHNEEKQADENATANAEQVAINKAKIVAAKAQAGAINGTGWQRIANEEGDMYYHRIDTNVTQWKRPHEVTVAEQPKKTLQEQEAAEAEAAAVTAREKQSQNAARRKNELKAAQAAIEAAEAEEAAEANAAAANVAAPAATPNAVEQAPAAAEAPAEAAEAKEEAAAKAAAAEAEAAAKAAADAATAAEAKAAAPEPAAATAKAEAATTANAEAKAKANAEAKANAAEATAAAAAKAVAATKAAEAEANAVAKAATAAEAKAAEAKAAEANAEAKAKANAADTANAAEATAAAAAKAVAAAKAEAAAAEATAAEATAAAPEPAAATAKAATANAEAKAAAEAKAKAAKAKAAKAAKANAAAKAVAAEEEAEVAATPNAVEQAPAANAVEQAAVPIVVPSHPSDDEDHSSGESEINTSALFDHMDKCKETDKYRFAIYQEYLITQLKDRGLIENHVTQIQAPLASPAASPAIAPAASPAASSAIAPAASPAASPAQLIEPPLELHRHFNWLREKQKATVNNGSLQKRDANNTRDLVLKSDCVFNVEDLSQVCDYGTDIPDMFRLGVIKYSDNKNYKEFIENLIIGLYINKKTQCFEIIVKGFQENWEGRKFKKLKSVNLVNDNVNLKPDVITIKFITDEDDHYTMDLNILPADIDSDLKFKYKQFTIDVIKKYGSVDIIEAAAKELIKNILSSKFNYIRRNIFDSIPFLFKEFEIEDVKYIITRSTSGISIQTTNDYSQSSITTGIFIPKNVEKDIIINNELTLSVLNKIIEYCKLDNNQINEFIKEYYLGYLYYLFSTKLQEISAYPTGIVLYNEFKEDPFNNYIIGKTGDGLVIQRNNSYSEEIKDGIYLACNQSGKSSMDAVFSSDSFALTIKLINLLKNTETIYDSIREKLTQTNIIGRKPALSVPKTAVSVPKPQLIPISVSQYGGQYVGSPTLQPALDQSFMNDKSISKIRDRITGTSDKKQMIITCGENCYSIIHSKLINFIHKFIEYKIAYGTQIEKDFYASFIDTGGYNDMLISKYINRLLFKRPKTFQKAEDQCKFRTTNSVGDNGVRQYDNVGKVVSETESLKLEETMSYDEMEIAAMLSMSWKTPVYNTGGRNNAVDPIIDNMINNKFVIYIGCIGARFERRPNDERPNHSNTVGKMEYRFMIVDKTQNTADNGYGEGEGEETPARKYLKMWYNMLGTEDGGNFPRYPDSKDSPDSKDFLNSALYTEIGDIYLNNNIYKARMKMSILPFLFEAETRGTSVSSDVYCHLVGLGIGVWAIDSEKQAQLLYETYNEILKMYTFTRIKVLDFSWFPENTRADCMDVMKDVNQDIEIVFGQNDPFQKTDKKNDKLVVAQFAWDSNAYPGNEFWIGHLTASGDPAAASCSGIAAMYENLNNTDSKDQLVYSYPKYES